MGSGSKVVIENNMKIGSSSVTGMYVGSSPVKSAYLGTTRIYDRITYEISCGNTTDIAATGTTITPSVTSKRTHGDGTVDTGRAWTVTAVTGTGATISGDTIVIGNNDTASTRSGTYTIKQTESNLTITQSWTQNASSSVIVSYGAITSTIVYSDIPASGTPTGGMSYTSLEVFQTVTYSSGSTGTITVSPSEYTLSMATGTYVTDEGKIVNVSGLGSTVKARTQITTVMGNITAHGVTTTNAISQAVYQEANVANAYYTLASLSVSYSKATSSGGNVSPVCRMYVYPYYTSGTRGSMVSTGCAVYNASTTASSTVLTIDSASGVVTWTSNASSASDRSAYVTVNARATSAKLIGGNYVYGTASATIYQSGKEYGQLILDQSSALESIWLSGDVIHLKDKTTGTEAAYTTASGDYATYTSDQVKAILNQFGSGTSISIYVNSSSTRSSAFSITSAQYTNLINGTNVTILIS